MKIAINTISKNEAQECVKCFCANFETGDIFWIVGGKGRSKKKPAGTTCSSGYRKIIFNGKEIYAHQIIWALYSGEWPELQIDHINRNKKDNRISNLRLATNAQNGRNLPIKKNNKSGHPGVSWDNITNKWRATIKVNYKQKNLGRYTDYNEAVGVRVAAEKKYFGEFARVS